MSESNKERDLKEKIKQALISTEKVISNLEEEYQKEVDSGLVKVISIPDIENVNYGRGVGYEINEFTPPENIGWISATGIRNSIKDGDNDWRTLVDESIQADVEKYLINTQVEF